MKKIFLIVCLCIMFIISLLMVFNYPKKNEKFYLDNEYYGDSSIIKIDSVKINSLIDSNKSFVVLVHIPGVCNSIIPFEPILKQVIDDCKLKIYSIPYEDIKETIISKYVKYSPSVVIFKNGKVMDYLDTTKNEHIPYYQSVCGFKGWIKKYILLK